MRSDLESDVIRAAQAWVARCHREPGDLDHPNIWADEADLALIAAVDALTVGYCDFCRGPCREFD
jgi:hypothetical protein